MTDRSSSGAPQRLRTLETLYLGVLARRTRVATKTRLVVEAAWPKPVMFFPARFDHWLMQTVALRRPLRLHR